MTLSSLVINQRYRHGPQEVSYASGRRKGGVVFHQPNKETYRPFFALLMDHNNSPPPGLQILTWLLCLISQGGNGTNNNMGTIKYKRWSHGTNRLLSPQRQSLVANCKSYHHCEALSAISCLIYGQRLPRSFLHIHAEQQKATWEQTSSQTVKNGQDGPLTHRCSSFVIQSKSSQTQLSHGATKPKTPGPGRE